MRAEPLLTPCIYTTNHSVLDGRVIDLDPPRIGAAPGFSIQEQEAEKDNEMEANKGNC